MDPTTFVTTLYWLALGREPDSEGLRSWLDAIARTGDATVVLAGLTNSAEYQARGDAVPADHRELRDAVIQAVGDLPELTPDHPFEDGPGTGPSSDFMQPGAPID